MTFTTVDYPGAVLAPAAQSNYGYDQKPDFKALVIHVAEEDADDNEVTPRWFADPRAKVSMHFYISAPEGTVYQCVPLSEGAWGHGVNDNQAGWRGRAVSLPPWAPRMNGVWPNLNLLAVGIEIEGRAATLNMPPGQWNALVALVRWLAGRYSIPLDRDHIVGHDEINRFKQDPGSRMPWDRLMAAMLPVVLSEDEEEQPPRLTGAQLASLRGVFGQGAIAIPRERQRTRDRYDLYLPR